MFHHKIYMVKISRSSNFNPISITFWCEDNIITFFFSIVMDNYKCGTTSVTIAIFSYSVLGNTAAGCDRIVAILSMAVFKALKIP